MSHVAALSDEGLVLLSIPSLLVNFLELLCTKPTDLAILLDTSASLDRKWQNVLRFTSTLVEGYDIGEKKTKISIGTFGGGRQQIIMRFNTLTGMFAITILYSWSFIIVHQSLLDGGLV